MIACHGSSTADGDRNISGGITGLGIVVLISFVADAHLTGEGKCELRMNYGQIWAELRVANGQLGATKNRL